MIVAKNMQKHYFYMILREKKKKTFIKLITCPTKWVLCVNTFFLSCSFSLSHILQNKNNCFESQYYFLTNLCTAFFLPWGFLSESYALRKHKIICYYLRFRDVWNLLWSESCSLLNLIVHIYFVTTNKKKHC